MSLTAALLLSLMPAQDLPLQAQYPLVRLSDLDDFRGLGISKQIAWNHWRDAKAHYSHFKDRLTGTNAFFTWHLEAGKCIDCWDALGNALGEHGRLEFRLSELDRLRRMIGDEAYRDRWMPPPCPFMFGPNP